MNRIGADKQREEKQKRNLGIVGLILLGLMVLSTVGYAFSARQTAQPVSPSSSTGQTPDGLWQVTVDGHIFTFQYDPNELKNITDTTSVTRDTYRNKQVYIDSTNPAITNTLGSFLSVYAARVQEGCNGPCERDIPEKNCTSDIIVVWRDMPTNRIRQEEQCVIIEGDLRTVQAFLYHLLQ